MKLGQDDADAMGVLGKKKRVYYLTFTKDHDRNQAIKTFVERFDKQPEKNFVEKRVLWLGPALEK
jgi:hypothetical protein